MLPPDFRDLSYAVLCLQVAGRPVDPLWVEKNMEKEKENLANVKDFKIGLTFGELFKFCVIKA